MDNDKILDFININEPYRSQAEMMKDFMLLLDMRIYYLYKYHMWVGPENNLQNMIGLVVSRAEFEMNLAKASESVVGAELLDHEAREIEAMNAYFAQRIENTMAEAADMPAIQLIQKFRLDQFETNCLLLAFAVQIEKKYEKLFAFLQDDITKKLPTAETAIKLFAWPGEMVADYYRYFTAGGTLKRFLLESNENEAFFNFKISLRPRITEYLLGTGCETGDSLIELFDWRQEIHDLYTDTLVANAIDMVLRPLQHPEEIRQETVLVYLRGVKGSGRKFQVKHAVKRARARCLFVDLKPLLEAPGDLKRKIQDMIGEAVLQEAYLCFCDFDQLLEEEKANARYAFISSLQDNVDYLSATVFITAEKTWKDTMLKADFVKVDIDLEETEENDRLTLWKAFTEKLCLAKDIELSELATKFRFSPGQIKNSVEQAAGLCEAYRLAAIDTSTLHKCCYAQVVQHLDQLATKIRPAYQWEDLVLPPDQLKLLQEACLHVKYRHTVFHQWGFKKKVAYGNGLSMLFSGPPGTGKTMAAQVIANQLHMEMYKIQLSQVVSKYIGETEKNLRQVFEEAKKSNCILFFDETDALFGKRSEVKDAHDRHANIETAYLLQQMEEYDGVIVMATNLLQNIDAAFMRRINFVITFPFPDAATRLLLWQKHLETGVPLAEDVNLPFLADEFKIAGGNIKNIVLHAAFLAASQNVPISMVHLLKSTVNEQRKNNIIVVKADLKEYADLVF